MKKIPNYRTHIIFGFIIAISFYLIYLFYLKQPYQYVIPEFAFAIIVVYIFSQGPDLDHKDSKIRRLFNYIWIPFMALMAISGLWYRFAGLGIVFIIVHSLKHRGIMHTFYMGLILSLPILLYDAVLFYTAFIVYCSHLVLDRIVGEIKT